MSSMKQGKSKSVASFFITTMLNLTKHVKQLNILKEKHGINVRIYSIYSSNDFFLFTVKKKMRKHEFSIISVSEGRKSIQNWFEHMQKYIDLKGEYFEKTVKLVSFFFTVVKSLGQPTYYTINILIV